jgi:hypothetical protein
MSDGVSGQDWNEREVTLCVDAYFEHLHLDLAGHAFNKSQLYRTLAEQTGRSNKSIERKFQNISAVLNKLGRPWISGLPPLPNYQGLLADVIGARGTDLHKLDVISSLSELDDLPPLFLEPPPQLRESPEALPEHMKMLVRKFDPVERDLRNRKLGEEGERLVIEHERRALRHAERTDLATQVRWISKEEGDGAGYDILSFDLRGEKKFIEVKTTTGGRETPFFLSRNERNFANAEKDRFQIMRLFDFRRVPRAFELRGDLENFVHLSTEVYRADFRS